MSKESKEANGLKIDFLTLPLKVVSSSPAEAIENLAEKF